MQQKRDIRDIMFGKMSSAIVTAEIRADGSGILCGVQKALREALQLDLAMGHVLYDGAVLHPGTVILRFTGSPQKVLRAEEVLMGKMAKTSGIASAAHQFVQRVGQRIQIVSGAWKKMPSALKQDIRDAVEQGGAGRRISDAPFLYIDKNYTAIFGGIASALLALGHLGDYLKVIHIRGTYGDITQEAMEAVENGAGIVFIDTGNAADIQRVSDLLHRRNLRHHVRIAFGGNIRLSQIDHLKNLDLDILDIGKAIIDAPLLDMRMEVVSVTPPDSSTSGVTLINEKEESYAAV